MNTSASNEADRSRMVRSGAIIIAIVVNPFSGYPISTPSVTSAGARLPQALMKSIEVYTNELVIAEADASGGDLRDLDRRLEDKLQAWLSGHSGSSGLPLVSVSVLEDRR